MNVPTPPAWSGDAFKNTCNFKFVPVNRANLVRGNNDYRIADIDLHTLRHEFRDPYFSFFESLFCAICKPRWKEGNRLKFLVRIDSIESDVGRLHKGAEHAPKFYSGREGFHFRLLFENLLQFLISLHFEVEIEGKVIYGGQITLPVNLQVAQHRVSHLSDHHVLERTAYRNEEENEN